MLFIDVREPKEFAEGHVDGALNLPLSGLSSNVEGLSGISKDAKLVLYCRSGNRSGVAISILRKLGYKNLENGINQDYVNKNYLVS